MECRLSVRFRAAPLLIVIACLLPGMAQAERTMVLVTNEECPLTEMSTLDMRKAYLGIAVTIRGYPIRAYRLNNDELLGNAFFQHVVAMSEKTYERRLLSMLLKFGTPRPIEFDQIDDLTGALGAGNCAIGYMWLTDAAEQGDIKVLKLLWKGD